eukprot:352827-Chlamydomonas_euryale.AAC.2
MHAFVGAWAWALEWAQALRRGRWQPSVSLSCACRGHSFPDDEGPESMKVAAGSALLEFHNQYPPLLGLPELRKAVAAHSEREQVWIADHAFGRNRPHTHTRRTASYPDLPQRRTASESRYGMTGHALPHATRPCDTPQAKSCQQHLLVSIRPKTSNDLRPSMWIGSSYCRSKGAAQLSALGPQRTGCPKRACFVPG